MATSELLPFQEAHLRSVTLAALKALAGASRSPSPLMQAEMTAALVSFGAAATPEVIQALLVEVGRLRKRVQTLQTAAEPTDGNLTDASAPSANPNCFEFKPTHRTAAPEGTPSHGKRLRDAIAAAEHRVRALVSERSRHDAAEVRASINRPRPGDDASSTRIAAAQTELNRLSRAESQEFLDRYIALTGGQEVVSPRRVGSKKVQPESGPEVCVLIVGATGLLEVILRRVDGDISVDVRDFLTGSWGPKQASHKDAFEELLVGYRAEQAANAHLRGDLVAEIAALESKVLTELFTELASAAHQYRQKLQRAELKALQRRTDLSQSALASTRSDHEELEEGINRKFWGPPLLRSAGLKTRRGVFPYDAAKYGLLYPGLDGHYKVLKSRSGGVLGTELAPYEAGKWHPLLEQRGPEDWLSAETFAEAMDRMPD